MCNKIIYRLARFFDRGELVLFLLCFLLIFCTLLMRFFEGHSTLVLRVLIGGILLAISNGFISKVLFSILAKQFVQQIKKNGLDQIGISLDLDQAVGYWVKSRKYEDIYLKANLLNLLAPFYRMSDARAKRDLFFTLLAKDELTESTRGALILNFHEIYLDSTVIKETELINLFSNFLHMNKPFKFKEQVSGLAKLHCVYPQSIRCQLEEKGLHHHFMYSFLGKGYSRYNPPSGILNHQRFDEFYFRHVGQGIKLKQILLKKMTRLSPNHVQWSVLNCLDFNIVFNFNYDVLCNFFETEQHLKVANFYSYYFEYHPSQYNLAVSYLKNRYSDKKILKLITTVVNYRDFFEKLKLLNFLILKRIYPVLPKKAKSWSELEISISAVELMISQGNFALNVQSILPLDGLNLREYLIVVPRTNYKLIKCSMLIKNCAGNGKYALEINQYKKTILFLQLKNVIKYCVETDMSGTITEMSGVAGTKPPEIIKQELQLLLTQKYIK